jgi:quinol monooxygenase YgiN
MKRARYRSVVQLMAKLIAPNEGVHELVRALRAVMWGARQARGCSFASVYCSGIEAQSVAYVEEWDDAHELRRQFGSERFTQLLALLETAAERPVVEFRVISATYGLEYITTPDEVERSNHL